MRQSLSPSLASASLTWPWTAIPAALDLVASRTVSFSVARSHIFTSSPQSSGKTSLTELRGSGEPNAAVHYGFAFLVISELEFWHKYLAMGKSAWSLEQKVMRFVGALLCMVGRPPYIRDPGVYGYAGVVKRSNGEISDTLTFGQAFLFLLVGGLMNVLIMSAVN